MLAQKQNDIQVKVPEKLLPLILKPKPLKIAVGGRGAGKTIAFSDVFLKFCDDGERIICAREFQNSIEESVHSSLVSRIIHHQISNIKPAKSAITSTNDGKIVYLGLARNIGSVKSFDKAGKVWIEEGQYISQESINILFPTIRENGSEIWISMNRGSSKDPVSTNFLKQAEPDLARCGYYEDDYMIIVEINWNDNPWFPDKLRTQMERDREQMDSATFDHIWNGKYSDTVKDAIIKPEWFDACVDAHKKLGFEPLGQEKVAYDPSDSGDDPEALAYMHGNVVLEAMSADAKSIDDATDWATDYTNAVQADVFIWDCDGMGIGLKRQVSDSFKGKKVTFEQFRGSHTAESPDSVYMPASGDRSKPKTNKETFANQRAQFYIALRDRMVKTWMAVKKGKYINPEELISFDSGIKHLDLLRSELCRIPRKYGGARIQILDKQQMKKLGIDSPNIADCVMMLMKSVDLMDEDHQDINFTSLWD